MQRRSFLGHSFMAGLAVAALPASAARAQALRSVLGGDASPGVPSGSYAGGDAHLWDFASTQERAASDITSAMERAERQLPAGIGLRLPSGVLRFSRPLQFTRQQGGLRGFGAGQTQLIYTGGPTQADLLSFGDGQTEIKGWTLSGFRIRSASRLRGGAAMRFRRFVRSNLTEIWLDGQDADGNGNLWDGLALEGIDDVYCQMLRGGGQNTGLRVQGEKQGWKADLALDGGCKLTGWRTGIHVAGAFGGFYGGTAQCIGNGINVLINTAGTDEHNRELTFGSTFVCDSATETNMLVDQVNAEQTLAWISYAGWMASTRQGDNLTIRNWREGLFRWEGGRCFNAARDGVRVEDPTTRVDLDATIDDNRGYGVNVTKGSGNVSVASGARLFGNRLGDLHGATRAG